MLSSVDSHVRFWIENSIESKIYANCRSWLVHINCAPFEIWVGASDGRIWNIYSNLRAPPSLLEPITAGKVGGPSRDIRKQWTNALFSGGHIRLQVRTVAPRSVIGWKLEPGAREEILGL